MGPREKIGLAEIVEVINGEATGRYLGYNSNITIIFKPDILKTSAIATPHHLDSMNPSFELHVGDLVHFVGEFMHSDRIYATSATKATNLRSSVRGIISYVNSGFGQVKLFDESIDKEIVSQPGYSALPNYYQAVAFLPYQHILNVRYVQYRCNEILRVRDEVVLDVVDNVSCKFSRLRYMAIRMDFPKMVYGRHSPLTAVDCLGIVVQIDAESREMMTLFCNGLDDGNNYVSTAIPKEARGATGSKPKIGDRYRFSANRISNEGNWVVKDLQYEPTACVFNQDRTAMDLRCRRSSVAKKCHDQTSGDSNMMEKQVPCLDRKRSFSSQEVYKGAKVINSENDQPRRVIVSGTAVVRNQPSSMAAYCGRPRCAELEAGLRVDGKHDLEIDQMSPRKALASRVMCKVGHDIEYKGIAKIVEVADHEAVGDLVSNPSCKVVMPLDAFTAASRSSSIPALTAYLRPDDMVLFIPENRFALQSSPRSSFSVKLAKRVDRKACYARGSMKKLTPGWGYIYCNSISGFPHHVNHNNHLSYFTINNLEKEVFTGLRLSLDIFFRRQDQIRLDALDQGGQTDHRLGPRWLASQVYFPDMIYGNLTDRIATNCLGILFAISRINSNKEDKGIFQGYLFCKGLGDGGIDTRLPTIDNLGNQRMFRVGDRFRFNATRSVESRGSAKWIVSSIKFDPSARIFDDDERGGFVVERGAAGFRTGVRKQKEMELAHQQTCPQQNSDAKSSLKITEREICNKQSISAKASQQVLRDDESPKYGNPLTTLDNRNRISIARGKRMVTLRASSKAPGSVAVGLDAHKAVNALSSMSSKAVNYYETNELGRGRGKGILRDNQKSKLLKSSNFAYSDNYCLATNPVNATSSHDQSYVIEQLRKEIDSLKAIVIDAVPPGYAQTESMIENNKTLSSNIAQNSAVNCSCIKLNETKRIAQSTGNLRLPFTATNSLLSHDQPFHSLKPNKIDSIGSTSFLDANILSHAPSAQSILKPAESHEATEHSNYIPSGSVQSKIGVSFNKSSFMNLSQSPGRLSINLPESHGLDKYNPDFSIESEMFTPSQVSSDDTTQNLDTDDCDDNELNMRKLEDATASLDMTNAADNAFSQNASNGQDFLSFSDLEAFCSSRNFSPGTQSYALMSGRRQLEPYLSCPHIPRDYPIVNLGVTTSTAQITDTQSVCKYDNQMGSSLWAMPGAVEEKEVIKEPFDKKQSCDPEKLNPKCLLTQSMDNRQNKDSNIKRKGQGATMLKQLNRNAVLRKLHGATICNRENQVEPLSSRQNHGATFSDQDCHGAICHDGNPNKETAAVTASKECIDSEIIHAVVQDEFLLDRMFEQYPELMKSFLRAKFKEEKENNAGC